MQIQELIRGAKNAVSLAQVCFSTINVVLLLFALNKGVAFVIDVLRNERKNGLFSPPMLNCFYIGLVLSLMRMEVPRNLTSFYYSQKTRAPLVQVLKGVFFV